MLNRKWHQQNRLPDGATQKQRIEWHLAHADACGCRPIPPTLLKAMSALTYVVFLRGMNGGGHRVFRPSQLAAELQHLDCVNVGAAGTCVIRKGVPLKLLRAELGRRLPFETTIAVCHGENVRELVANSPFATKAAPAGVVRFVSILPSKHLAIEPQQLPATGKWLVRIQGQRGAFVYGEYRRHMKTIRYLGQLDRLLGAPVTTRNWNTMTAIAKLVSIPALVERRADRRAIKPEKPRKTR